MTVKIKYHSHTTKEITEEYSHTAPCYLAGEIFTNSSLVIAKWTQNLDGTGKWFFPSQRISNESELEGVTDLYAQWDIKNAGQVKIQNGDVVTDISDLNCGISYVYGRNQPFSYVRIQIPKNLFNDTSVGGYWNTRGLPKPALIQRETKIIVDVYGILGTWLFEKNLESDGMWEMIAVTQAYSLKDVTLRELLNIKCTLEYTKDKKLVHDNFVVEFTHLGITQSSKEKIGEQPKISYVKEDGRFVAMINVCYHDTTQTHGEIVSDGVMIAIDASGVLEQDKETRPIEISEIMGSGSAVFALIARYCGGFKSEEEVSDIWVDSGYLYDFKCVLPEPEKFVTATAIKDTYTQEEIGDMKKATHFPLFNDKEVGHPEKWWDAKFVDLRVDEKCWTIVQGIGALSNRVAFFTDKAYFVDYDVYKVGGMEVPILMTKFKNVDGTDSAEKLKIDWGGVGTISGEEEEKRLSPDVMGISVNADQGSSYVLKSQRVLSESYQRTISISNTASATTGTDIKHMFACDYAWFYDNKIIQFGSIIRDFQANMIALNQLINWYKPGDSIQYDVCETKREYTYTNVPSYQELTTNPEYLAGITILLVDTPYTALVCSEFVGRVYKGKKVEDKWVWPDEQDYQIEGTATLERVPRYDVYSKAKEIVDIQNGFTLTNVPLAEVRVSYPSCITTYTWGNPYFTDSESQMSTVEGITGDTTRDGTGDTKISDKYVARIAVGNKNLSDIDVARTGYSGLILEKNMNSDVYRLGGYDRGELQAEFNSRGKITAGISSSGERYSAITLDRAGLRTYNNAETSDEDWTLKIGMDGVLYAGRYVDGGVEKHSVELGANGLRILYGKEGENERQAVTFTPDGIVNGGICRLMAVRKKEGEKEWTEFQMRTSEQSPISIVAEKNTGGGFTGHSFLQTFGIGWDSVKYESYTDTDVSGGLQSLLSNTSGSVSFNGKSQSFLFVPYLDDGWVKFGVKDANLPILKGTLIMHVEFEMYDPHPQWTTDRHGKVVVMDSNNSILKQSDSINVWGGSSAKITVNLDISGLYTARWIGVNTWRESKTAQTEGDPQYTLRNLSFDYTPSTDSEASIVLDPNGIITEGETSAHFVKIYGGALIGDKGDYTHIRGQCKIDNLIQGNDLTSNDLVDSIINDDALMDKIADKVAERMANRT